jgi:hypothetical protein
MKSFSRLLNRFTLSCESIAKMLNIRGRRSLGRDSWKSLDLRSKSRTGRMIEFCMWLEILELLEACPAYLASSKSTESLHKGFLFLITSTKRSSKSW